MKFHVRLFWIYFDVCRRSCKQSSQLSFMRLALLDLCFGLALLLAIVPVPQCTNRTIFGDYIVVIAAKNMISIMLYKNNLIFWDNRNKMGKNRQSKVEW